MILSHERFIREQVLQDPNAQYSYIWYILYYMCNECEDQITTA